MEGSLDRRGSSPSGPLAEHGAPNLSTPSYITPSRTAFLLDLQPSTLGGGFAQFIHGLPFGGCRYPTGFALGVLDAQAASVVGCPRVVYRSPRTERSTHRTQGVGRLNSALPARTYSMLHRGTGPGRAIPSRIRLSLSCFA